MGRSAPPGPGTWTITDLLPTAGFPHAYNPQMLLTHQPVHYLDSDGKDQANGAS